MNNKNKILLTLLIIGVAFWIINTFTPEYLDDYLYKFAFEVQGVNIKHPITTLNDVFVSQFNHYFCFNGRVIVHTIVQIFTGLLGKDIFNVFNACMFMLFVFLTTKLTSQINMLNLFFSTAIIFVLFPSFNDCALWMTGSINYLWSSTIVCLFLYCFALIEKKELKKKHILWGGLCIFAGWSHEGITFPLALSLLIYSTANYKTIYNRAVFPLIVGFILGAFLCVFSPATLSRGDINEGLKASILISKIFSGLTLCMKLRAIWLLVMILIILSIINRKKWGTLIQNYYFRNLILCNAYILSLGVIFLSGFTSSRTAIAEELLGIVLLLNLLEYLNMKYMHYIKVAFCVAFLLIYSNIVYYSIKNYEEYNNLLSQIQEKKSSVIITNEVQVSKELKRYIRMPLESTDSEFYESFCYNSAWNNLMSITYHCDSLVFIPSMVYEDIVENNARIGNIKSQNKYPFYVIPVPLDFNGNRVTFLLKPTIFSKLPFYIRPIAHRMEKYMAKQLPANKLSYIIINNHRYLLVGKNHLIDDRLNDIIIE